jgi:hypothetical protein
MSPFAFCLFLPFCKSNLSMQAKSTEEPTFHACPFVPPPLNIARAARITSYAIPAAAVERVYRQLRSQDAGK